MNQLLLGMLVSAAAVVGLYFLRFFRDSRDPFFLLFALAFWALALNWLGLALLDPTNETRVYFYLLRIGAFGLILGAIWHKNRPRAA